jgi:NAD(P)-dependent dehydrogenase (short-subunit alcohol dehydrogenase family)
MPATRSHRSKPSLSSRSKGPLAGRVAVVAGATRGAGRGIARALGEAGATVYCTGRSVAGNPSPYGRPETITETADLITAAGGTGIAVRVDHTVEAEVQALFDRIQQEHGRLDILVNSIAGEDPMMGQWGNFWKTKLEHSDAILRQALVSHMITAKHAAPLMIKKRHGLIVEVTENDVLGAGGNPLSQTVKLALKGLALNMATELKTHGVAAVAITPGFLRSEAMLQGFGVTEDNWRDGGKKDKNFLESESPLFVGRAVAALAGDPKVLERTGHLFSSWDLANHYGFSDADGRRPDWGAFKPDLSQHPAWLIELIDTGLHLQRDWLTALTRRTERYLTNWMEPVAAARQRKAAGTSPKRSAIRPKRSAIKRTSASRARARRGKRG